MAHLVRTSSSFRQSSLLSSLTRHLSSYSTISSPKQFSPLQQSLSQPRKQSNPFPQTNRFFSSSLFSSPITVRRNHFQTSSSKQFDLKTTSKRCWFSSSISLNNTPNSSDVSEQAIVELFYDPATFTATYAVVCPETKKCAIIDPVWDFDFPSGSLRTTQAEKILKRADEQGWTIEWILETHAHADHVTSSQYLKKKTGAKVCIGEGITTVQKTFQPKFNFEFATDGSQFDVLFEDGEEFSIGNLPCQVIAVPGHTPDSISYYIKNDCVFPGDTLFMPDSGSARCDFPNGSAEDLYNSAQKLLKLPSDVRFFICHDYQPGGRQLEYQSTVGDQASSNKHVKEGISKGEFVKMRSERDATLSVPKLLMPSVQLNILAGNLPPAEDNGTSYIKIPLNCD